MKTIIIVSSDTILDCTTITDNGIRRERPAKDDNSPPSDDHLALAVFNLAKALGVPGRFVWQPEWKEGDEPS